MNDAELRAAVKRKLLRRYLKDPYTTVLEEMSLEYGACRIDLAVVNSSLHGFELKSDSDSLERLPDQARVYSSVFDKVTLVVGYRHACEALNMVPMWWGVKLAHVGRYGGICFSDARVPKANPSKDPMAIARLLSRDEALQMLQEMGKADGVRSKPSASVYKRLVEATDLERVRLRVRQRLALRTALRSASQQMSDGGWCTPEPT